MRKHQRATSGATVGSAETCPGRRLTAAMQAPRIIDSTLREGEQFAHARFSTDDKVAIARALDALGVDYLELTSPAISPRARRDVERIVELRLRSRIIAHGRCTVSDVQAAIDAGVDAVGLYFATSPVLRRASHGREIQQVIDAMAAPIARAVEGGLETRFSAEDAFRTSDEDLVRVAVAAARLGVHRVGVADTIGTATPSEVYRVVSLLKQEIPCDVGFHGHNDTGCAIANAYEAARAGASHVDVSVLGIGERVGITPLGGFLARLLTTTDAPITERYRLDLLAQLETLVARCVGVQVPFNTCITGRTAYSHKAGTHIKAMIENPASYEAIAPERFGLDRTLVIGSPLTGRHAIAHRARQLGVRLSPEEVAMLTTRVKELAHDPGFSEGMLDELLRARGDVHER